jgi:hypothetical protein
MTNKLSEPNANAPLLNVTAPYMTASMDNKAHENLFFLASIIAATIPIAAAIVDTHVFQPNSPK